MPDTDQKTAPAANSAPNPREQPVPQGAQDKGGPAQAKPDEKLYPVGIAGAKLDQQPRKTPDNEPPPLPPNDQLNVIGKPTPRLDGRAKVTGAAKYTADIKLPGMLYGRMVTSDVPHAKITSIDTSAAEKAPGVKAVHVLERDQSAAHSKDDEKE